MAATLPSFAQVTADSSALDGRRHHRQRQFQDETVEGSGAGTVDSTARISRQTRRLKDRFVDLDGDGICDDRANGLGFKHGFGKGASAARVNVNGKRMKGKQ